MSETDKKKGKESASSEFSKVIDATASFLKSIFPHCYAFVATLRGKFKRTKVKAK